MHHKEREQVRNGKQFIQVLLLHIICLGDQTMTDSIMCISKLKNNMNSRSTLFALFLDSISPHFQKRLLICLNPNQTGEIGLHKYLHIRKRINRNAKIA